MIRQGVRELPAAVRTYWRYRPRGFTVYYSPFFCPYVLGTVALTHGTAPYARMVGIGFLLFAALILIELGDRFADVPEDQVLHPRRTEEFLASRSGAILLAGILILGIVATLLAFGGVGLGVATVLVGSAFASLNLAEQLVSKVVVRVLASSVFGIIPVFVAYGLHLDLLWEDAVLSLVMLTGAQLAWSWLDDAGDRVRGRNLAAADRWLAGSAVALGVSIAAGFALLWHHGGAVLAVLGLITVVPVLPFLSTLGRADRHERAVEKRIEPRLELRWEDGSSWIVPLWLTPMGFPMHVFVLIALTAL